MKRLFLICLACLCLVRVSLAQSKCGYDGPAAQTGTSLQNLVIAATPCVTAIPIRVLSCTLNIVGVASVNWGCAVYPTTAGIPTVGASPLCNGFGVNIGGGSQTIPLPTCGVFEPGTYFITFQIDSDLVNTKYTIAGEEYYFSYTYGAFPAWPVSFSSFVATTELWLNVIPATGTPRHHGGVW